MGTGCARHHTAEIVESVQPMIEVRGHESRQVATSLFCRLPRAIARKLTTDRSQQAPVGLISFQARNSNAYPPFMVTGMATDSKVSISPEAATTISFEVTARSHTQSDAARRPAS